MVAAVMSPSGPIMCASPVYVIRRTASSYLRSLAVAVERTRSFFFFSLFVCSSNVVVVTAVAERSPAFPSMTSVSPLIDVSPCHNWALPLYAVFEIVPS